MTSYNKKVLAKAKKQTDGQLDQIRRPVASAPIQMEIVFGRPSKECQDIGICRISMLPTPLTTSKQQCKCEGKALVWIQQLQDGSLIFRFPKNQMLKKTIEEQF